MAMERPPTQASTSDDHLRAILRIEPDARSNCSVAAAGQRSERVTHSISDGSDEHDDGVCCADISPAEGEAVFIVDEVADYCVCPVFRTHGCVFAIEGFEDGELLVRLSVTSRHELESIVSSLREREAVVRLERICEVGADGPSDPNAIEFETSAITEKQREAIELAVEKGYYETPRQTDLGELAMELGVSKSAVSQRITGVESKLVAGLVASTQ